MSRFLNKRFIIRYLLLFCCLLTGSCGKKTAPPAPPQRPLKIEEFVPPPKMEISKYYYRGERFRDPFIPLEDSAKVSLELVIPDINALTLKGIFDFGGLKAAILVAGGHSYIARENKLYDRRNRVIPGFSCTIKGNLVIIRKADITREIKLKDF